MVILGRKSMSKKWYILDGEMILVDRPEVKEMYQNVHRNSGPWTWDSKIPDLIGV